MPTTKIKNLLYRAALPFLAPSPGCHPIRSCTGHTLCTAGSFSSLIRKHHVLGSATLLSLNGEETLVLTDSSQPRHIPTENTFFRVASITKMATSLLALKLAENNGFSLDQPVSDLLKGFGPIPSELDQVTLRHLLSHTSGLSDPPGMETALESGEPWTVVIAGCRVSSPGEAFHYSNLGFGLVGCVLEAVSGRPLGRLFEEELFIPLKMNAVLDASMLSDSQIMPVTRVLPWHPYQDLTRTPLGRTPLKAPDPMRHYGHSAGSLYTDIRSLRQLMNCLMNNGKPLLRSELAQEMIREHAAYGSLSPSLFYGLGMLIIRNPLLSPFRLLGHQGFAYGCADGAFWEEESGALLIHLNGGASEARIGRLGLLNYDLLAWALRKEFPLWN